MVSLAGLVVLAVADAVACSEVGSRVAVRAKNATTPVGTSPTVGMFAYGGCAADWAGAAAGAISGSGGCGA